jgi:hypothetical protein
MILYLPMSGLDKIESGLLKQQYALAIFLDIAGAFNSITFKAAINAMRKRGFPKNITNWYNHFLHNQVSTLELDNCRFTRELKTGTPQSHTQQAALYLGWPAHRRGGGRGGGARGGHLRYWEGKIKEYNIAVK